MANFNTELRRKSTINSPFDDLYYVKTTVTLVDGLLNGGKILESLLPASVFGGMRNVGPLSFTAGQTTTGLKSLVQTYVTANGGTFLSCYFIATGTGVLTVSVGTALYTDTGTLLDGSGTYTVNAGDWVISKNADGSAWGVVNNAYADATTTTRGIMSAADKLKLDGIAANATNYSHPTQTAINGNATDNGVSVIDSVTVNTLGHVTAVGTRDLSNATPSAAGVMSAADKTKLNGIAESANNYTHPAYTAIANLALTSVETMASFTVDATGHITAGTKQAIRSATSALTGISRFATALETRAGTDATLGINPSTLGDALFYFGGSKIPTGTLTFVNDNTAEWAPNSFALVIV
jgi:hypothetical protein